VTRDAVSGVVFLIGAGLYALLQRSGTVDFNATPVSVGVIAIVAGLASGGAEQSPPASCSPAGARRCCSWPTGLSLRRGRLPAYMRGIGAGLVVAAAVAPKAQRGEWLTSGAIAAVLGPLGLYLSYDVGVLGRWPAWALSLLALAGWELFWALGPRSAHKTTAAR